LIIVHNYVELQPINSIAISLIGACGLGHPKNERQQALDIRIVDVPQAPAEGLHQRYLKIDQPIFAQLPRG